MSSVAFVPFTTFIDPTFWSTVNCRKVNEWQLNTTHIPINASFSLCSNFPLGLKLEIGHSAFDEIDFVTIFEKIFVSFPVAGNFLLTNTKKEFNLLNRNDITENCGKNLFELIQSKKWLESPYLLNTFFLTSYADVKQFVYYFLNFFPVLLYPNQIMEKFPPASTGIENFYNISLSYLKNCTTLKNCNAFIIVNEMKALPLSAISEVELDLKSVILVFLNPSNIEFKPAWPLRNLISAIAYLRPDCTELKVLALRRQLSETFLLNICWQKSDICSNTLKCVGWERNRDGVQKFQKIDLKSMFDPLQIMEESASLNLKLMRWRQVPSINLDKFTQLRVLIIGSGTLGCNLSRALLGWGVRNFTFIDHACVSYNNPIRQSLFEFNDCQSGHYNKAQAASDSLLKIFPCVNSSGVDMKIPMPGHPYSDSEKETVKKVCEDLDELICSHDVVFLVMDSRESRWLPTLISSCRNKLAITVALGFDSYLVIRHGSSTPETKVSENIQQSNSLNLDSLVSGNDLGCYFCSDVTAPGNSLADRTLDQQCTISRSGISMIASGIAVELMASVLQHDLGQGAPALLAGVDENSSLLGGTPHQLRGFVSRFHQMTPTVCRFDKCTGCGTEVSKRYLDPNNFDLFLHKVFQDSSVLENITGLTKLQQSVDQINLDMLEIDDSDSM